MAWEITNHVIDSLFLIDIILSFISAYYTDEYELIEDRWVIARNYIFTWFIIDVLAIIPFELIFSATSGETSSSNMNDMIRLARLGRLYKIVRLLRLFRILKLGKSSGEFLKQIKDYLKISPGAQRLMIFVVVFAMICHVVACVWIILA
jgi:hypothetical protein